MNKILTLDSFQASTDAFHQENKKIVLVGGCFDILHQGHIEFLDAAKQQGDALCVMLESDQAIKKRKGENRPINDQATRASILASLPSVTMVLLLPEKMDDTSYDEVVLSIKPAIIATTKGDSGRMHKERQAAQINAQVLDVIDRIPNLASSDLARHITEL